MDDFAKHASSYQLDQEILDEESTYVTGGILTIVKHSRGINMTVEEVAGLPTCKYSERVQSLHLSEDDLVFLKGLRRRIKNRLASQNSRRRSTEQLRRLARELRALRASRHAALAERRALLAARGRVRERCEALREYVVKVLNARSDTTKVPALVPELFVTESQSTDNDSPRTLSNASPPLKDLSVERDKHIFDSLKDNVERDRHIFECRIEKLVQQSVNHIYKEKKKITAKTVFITDEAREYESVKGMEGGGEVLNLSLKSSQRRSHGRKQSAPRRITCMYDNEDGVLDLKIKKENQ